MMASRSIAALFTLICFSATLCAQPQVRPIKRPPNNQLALEGPNDTAIGRIDATLAVSGITSQLVFHVSPLSAKGLLSQQIEDAIKALDKANGAATFLKIRAFVAGTGDLRRVQTIVNVMFSEKKLPIPVVTTVQVGSLPLEGAQVIIESISEEKKPVNPAGLAFLPTVETATGAEAVTAMQTALAGATPLRLTCFADSQAEAESARATAAKLFPKLTGVFAQSTRYTLGSRAACEAIAQGGPVQSAKLVFAAAQLTFGEEEADLALAFDRLDKALEPQGIHRSDAVLVNAYATSRAVADKARALAAPTPRSAVFIEGLPSQDATLSVEAIIPAK
ncbi:MAG: hypothetical protein ABIR70_02370 [Bryobacteraceae bacterium]